MSDLMFTATLYGTVEKAQAAQIEHLTRELTESKARIAELKADVSHKDEYATQLGRLLAKTDAECKSLRAEVEALRGFAQKAMGAWPECGLDGFDLEEYAQEFGLIRSTRVESPCGEGCACAEAGADFPNDCYHKTALLIGSGPWVNPLAAEVEALRARIDRAEVSYGNMLRADDKRPNGTTDYTRGWGDCLRVIAAQRGEGE